MLKKDYIDIARAISRAGVNMGDGTPAVNEFKCKILEKLANLFEVKDAFFDRGIFFEEGGEKHLIDTVNPKRHYAVGKGPDFNSADDFKSVRAQYGARVVELLALTGKGNNFADLRASLESVIQGAWPDEVKFYFEPLWPGGLPSIVVLNVKKKKAVFQMPPTAASKSVSLHIAPVAALIELWDSK